MARKAEIWRVASAAAVACLAMAGLSPLWLWPGAAFAALALVGLVDFSQPRQAIRRNYPVIAHFRFFFEYIRPEIRQYFIEADTDHTPFSRAQRSIVYQRAKGAVDKRPFGTQMDFYEPHYEWINHSIAPVEVGSHDFRIAVGEGRVAKPYSASVFNVSAMSFGALSANAVLALNEGARRGRFFHDTGEGSISRYHREPGGDLVWEIGSGYFGCRDDDGRFNEERFVANAASDQVKMIEVKLSQGAKPGHGGVLPGAKVTPEIAEARGVPVGVDCISPARHSAFDSPEGLLRFVQQLRELSGGKPVGFKLAIGHPWEWFGIAKAMHSTGIRPDFIVGELRGHIGPDDDCFFPLLLRGIFSIHRLKLGGGILALLDHAEKNLHRRIFGNGFSLLLLFINQLGEHHPQGGNFQLLFLLHCRRQVLPDFFLYHGTPFLTPQQSLSRALIPLSAHQQKPSRVQGVEGVQVRGQRPRGLPPSRLFWLRRLPLLSPGRIFCFAASAP